MHTADADLEVRVPVKAGSHEVGVSFVRRLWEPEGVLQPPQTRLRPHDQRVCTTAIRRSRSCRSAARTDARAGRLAEPPQESSSAAPAGPAACRGSRAPRRFCRRWRARAYRRPGHRRATSRRCSPSTRRGRAERAASTPASSAASSASWPPRASCSASSATRAADGRRAPPYRLSDLELASRLSFFLWSSIPDDELLRRGGARERCSDPAVLEQQVRRMLRDPRSQALVDNFAGQWLELAQARGRRARPGCCSRVRREPARGDSSRRPGCSSAASCARTAASLELLTANYTFVNERLAPHYGIPNVYGSHFRRVDVRRRQHAAACSARAAS